MDLKRMKQIGWFFVITGVLCSLFLWSQRTPSIYKILQINNLQKHSVR